MSSRVTATMDLFLTATDCLAGEITEIGRLARGFWTTYWTTWAAHSGMATKDVCAQVMYQERLATRATFPPISRWTTWTT